MNLTIFNLFYGCGHEHNMEETETKLGLYKPHNKPYKVVCEELPVYDLLQMCKTHTQSHVAHVENGCSLTYMKLRIIFNFK